MTQLKGLELVRNYLRSFKKAFETIEWSFLIETLKAFNFEEKFINWINLLYTNILSCVSNNEFQRNAAGLPNLSLSLHSSG